MISSLDNNRASLIIAKTIARITVISSRRLDRLVLVLECLSLSVVRRRQQIAAILDHLRLSYSPLHHFGREIITVADIGEANDEILRLAVLDQCNAGNDFDTQSLSEKRTLFSVDFDEARLEMFWCEHFEMLVDNLAAIGAVAVEVTDDVLGLL